MLTLVNNMFLAINEINKSKLRYILITSVVCLIAVLVFFLQV